MARSSRLVLDSIRAHRPDTSSDRELSKYNAKAAKFKTVSDKGDAIKAAKDLHYGPAVIERLMNAESNAEIERIMATARKRRLE